MKSILPFLFLLSLCSSGCNNADDNQIEKVIKSNTQQYEIEKQAILATLNGETKAAFQRNYQAWTEYWVHDPSMTKTYINVPDNSYSESIGWKEISGFVKNYITEHPEPEALPPPLTDIDIRLYTNGAWVSYEQQNDIHGLKRETRLMEKIDGSWKIAGMQTTIYGFE